MRSARVVSTVMKMMLGASARTNVLALRSREQEEQEGMTHKEQKGSLPPTVNSLNVDSTKLRSERD